MMQRENKIEQICDFLKGYENKFREKKVLIWGAWQRGLDYQKALKYLGVEIEGFIDSDTSKMRYGEPKKRVTTAEILKKDKYFVILTVVHHKSIRNCLDESAYKEYEDYIYPEKIITISNVFHGYRDLYGNIVEGNTDKSIISISGNSKIIIGKGVKLGEVKIKCGWHSLLIIDDGVVIKGGNININDYSVVIIGAGVKIAEGLHISTLKSSYIDIGKNTTIAERMEMRVELNSGFYCGEDCMLSYDIKIRADHGHGIIDRNRNIVRKACCETKLGSHVWIGMGAFLLGGSEIGNHSMVGAGSLVNKKFPDYVTIAGNPAQIIKENTDWIRDNSYPDREYSVDG